LGAPGRARLTVKQVSQFRNLIARVRTEMTQRRE